MAKVHNFKECLEFERKGYERQDKFYMQHFHCIPFNERIPYEENRQYQKSDRDLDFIYNGKVESISEKNRKKDRTDTLFEIWSAWPNDEGWAMHSNATLLCYFMPSSIIVVNMKDMLKILKDPANKISRQVKEYEEGCRSMDIWINGKFYYLPVIRAQNEGYSSISIAFTDEQLKQLGIRFKRF